MTILRALILGLIQGATEFLPVSSSGHLVLLPWLFGWHDVGESNLAFDALVHWGTLVAVLAYFWRDIWRIVTAVWDGLCQQKPLATPDARLGWFIVLGSIPAAVLGFVLEDWFEEAFGNPVAASVALWGTAGLLVFSELVGKRLRKLDSMNGLDAILLGCAQALAIFPGLSRSGSTISVALLRNFERESAARFSFLLGIPAVTGAGAYQLLKLWLSGDISGQLDVLLLGFLAAAVVGYLSIHTLLLFVRKRSLFPFAVYCALLGGTSLVVYVLRG